MKKKYGYLFLLTLSACISCMMFGACNDSKDSQSVGDGDVVTSSLEGEGDSVLGEEIELPEVERP